MAKLLVISNRVPVPGSARRAGGLSVAVEGALRRRGGVWIGWDGSISDGEGRDVPRRAAASGIDYVTFSLSARERDLYYSEFSNRTLWPGFHYREDLIRHSQEALSCYRSVNDKFARHAMRVASGEDLIWVHDYHLLGLGAALKRRGARNPIGFFLHVPFPPEGIAEAFPPALNLAGLLAAYDVVGVQTQRDADHLRGYLSARAGAAAPAIRVCPVGIRPELLSRAARLARRGTAARMSSAGLSRGLSMVSVERMDYSKGIPQRLKAYEHFLANAPEWIGRVSLVQIAPLSRSEVPEYIDIVNDVDSLSGRINGRFADLSWSPIHYTNAYVTPFSLAGLFRAARVGLVTPLRDGMNLVSKEYIAAQDPADPGVLVLSKFAGSAEQLRSALLVDPRNIEEVGGAIRQALEMPGDERRERHADMMRSIARYDARAWFDDFVGALSDVGAREAVG